MPPLEPSTTTSRTEKPPTRSWFGCRFRDWVDTLGIGHYVAHQARHTRATNLLRNGADLTHVKRYLGQVSEKMAEHYVHLWRRPAPGIRTTNTRPKMTTLRPHRRTVRRPARRSRCRAPRAGRPRPHRPEHQVQVRLQHVVDTAPESDVASITTTSIRRSISQTSSLRASARVVVGVEAVRILGAAEPSHKAFDEAGVDTAAALALFYNDAWEAATPR
ncbi:tyrosine-type recombinase/integrase [Streptomyces sp. NPDC002206]